MKTRRSNAYRGSGCKEYVTVIVVPLQYDTSKTKCRVIKGGHQASFKVEANSKDVDRISDIAEKAINEHD